MPEFNMNLVDVFRNVVTKWWTGKQTAPMYGIDSIASEFINRREIEGGKVIDLKKRILFEVRVHRVIINDRNKVEVTYSNINTGKDITVTTDAVLITVPLPVLREMNIDFPPKVKAVLDDVVVFPATKILIQCHTRFWEKEVGQGGCSRTNLPICQLHYPSPLFQMLPKEKGILTCYLFGQDALEFGGQEKDAAVERAVSEIEKIHSDIKESFEVGAIQDWSRDESAQTSYACLSPNVFWNGLSTLMTPNHPIYLAGDGVSHTNVWMQGALESGLNAAFHLFSNIRIK